LIVNGGVIGHEYFHAIFNSVVLQPLRASMATELAGESAANLHEGVFPGGRECGLLKIDETGTPPDPKIVREMYRIRLLRAMNEGLADFWGWIYSGETDFVGRSLSYTKGTRNLDGGNTKVGSHIKFWQDSEAWESADA